MENVKKEKAEIKAKLIELGYNKRCVKEFVDRLPSWDLRTCLNRMDFFEQEAKEHDVSDEFEADEAITMFDMMFLC